MTLLIAPPTMAQMITCDGNTIPIEESWQPMPDFSYERVTVRHARAEVRDGARWEVSLPSGSGEPVVLPEKAVTILEKTPGRIVFHTAESIKHPLHLAILDGESPVLYLFLDPPGYGSPPQGAIDVRTLGIEPSTEEVLTERINSAIAQLSKDGGGTLLFPHGTYTTGTIQMRDGVFLHLEKGALVQASLNLDDFPIDPPGTEFLDLPRSLRPGAKRRLVLFDHVKDSGITGQGTLDGRGSEMRRLYQKPRAFMNMVRMVGCSNLRIEGVTIKDSEFWSTHIILSEDIRFDGIKIFNEIPPPKWDAKNPSSVWNNADGINPDSSTRVTVENSFFHTGDDCLPVKNTSSFKGLIRDVSDITVKRCMMISPVTAMKIGTETLGSRIERVLFEDIEVVSTSRVFGADMKDGAVADNITLRDIRVFRCNRLVDLWILHREGAEAQDRFSNLSNVVIDRLHIRRAGIDPAGYESHIQGRDADHLVTNVLLRDVRIAGKALLSPDDYPIQMNEFVKDIRFEASERPTLICFGDSITANGLWVNAPETTQDWTLVNAGRAGRKTTDIPTEFAEALAQHPEATGLLIMLGVNDLPARDPRSDDDKIAACLAHIQGALDTALDRFHPDAILLAAPPGVDVDGMDSVNRTKGYPMVAPLLQRLEVGLEQLAQENGVRFVSLQQTVRPGQFSDGLHPNAEGDAAIAQALSKALPQPKPVFQQGALPAFYLVGDSISIDYHDALERECRGHYRYSRKGGLELARSDLDHPQGANGGDSAAILEHLTEVLRSPSSLPETLLVNCGLHDIKIDATTGIQQVSLEAYRQNLEKIVKLVHESGRRLVWITTTPLDEERHNARSRAFFRHERDLATYNATAREVMDAHGVKVIDLYGFTVGLDVPLFRDHVHFYPQVSELQAGFLRSALDTLFSQ